MTFSINWTTSVRAMVWKPNENLPKENIRSKLSIIFLVFIIALRLSKIQLNLNRGVIFDKHRCNVIKPILNWWFAIYEFSCMLKMAFLWLFRIHNVHLYLSRFWLFVFWIFSSRQNLELGNQRGSYKFHKNVALMRQS